MLIKNFTYIPTQYLTFLSIQRIVYKRMDIGLKSVPIIVISKKQRENSYAKLFSLFFFLFYSFFFL